MKIGSLIKYINPDNEIVFGVVIEYFDNHKQYQAPTAKVLWMDDMKHTLESLTNLFDTKIKNLEVLSYAWT